MLAYDEKNRIDEFREKPGLKVCNRCHRIYRSITEEQVPGFREKEDDVCPYCGRVNWQSMSYDFFNSQLKAEEIATLDKVIDVTADKGYNKTGDMIDCLHAGVIPDAYKDVISDMEVRK